MQYQEGGDVFTFGSGEHGQLGSGNCENKLTPHKVRTFDQKIGSISCGKYHSLFLTTHGKVYSCGRNKKGELGTGNRKAYLYPQKIVALETLRIIKIRAGYHSAALTFKGDLYIWGSTELGSNLTPVAVGRGLETAFADVQMGGSSTFLLDLRGYVYTFGTNAFGELGLGDNNSRKKITRVARLNDRRVSSLAVGKNHVIALGECISKEEFDSTAETLNFYHHDIRKTLSQNTKASADKTCYDESSNDNYQAAEQVNEPGSSPVSPHKYGSLKSREQSTQKIIRRRPFSSTPGGNDVTTNRNLKPFECGIENASVDDLIKFMRYSQDLSEIGTCLDRLSIMLDNRDQQTIFYEQKIVELQELAVENEEKDLRMLKMMTKIEEDHQQHTKESRVKQQLLIDQEHLLKVLLYVHN